MSGNLSLETERCIATLFPPAARAEAARLLLQGCGNNLPLLKEYDEFQLERFRFASLKLSAGDIVRLKKAIQLAQEDWRDLLVSAEFGEVNSHKLWFPAK